MQWSMWHEATSGLKINLVKSELIPVGEVANVDKLARILHCRVGTLSSRYLGLPLGGPFKSTWVCDVIEERFQKQLAMWKRQYLLEGGKLTLIKSTLSSLSIYFMPLFMISQKVNLRLEKI